MIDFATEESEFYCSLHTVKTGFNHHTSYIKYPFRL